MTVKITKPEFNIREKINELHKPSGIAGEAMLRAETPQEQFSLIGAGRKNLIINGGFDIWQRGTTLNTTMYSADRWMQWMTNSGVSNRNVNCTKQTGGPIGKNSSYIRYAPQVVDTGMEKFAWGQKIEKINLDHIESGQQLTLSFWIKREQSLPVNNNMDIQILYPNSADNWSAGYLFRNDENIDQTLDSISFNSLSAEWTKYSYTFIPRDTALDRGLAVYWHVGDTNFSLNNTDPLISFTGVQLEIGNVATPFEHRSYGEELAHCQRYYERIEGTQAWDQAVGFGDKIYVPIKFHTQKRDKSDVTVNYSNANPGTWGLFYGTATTSASVGNLITGWGTATSDAHHSVQIVNLSADTYTPRGTAVLYGIKSGQYIAFDSEL